MYPFFLHISNHLYALQSQKLHFQHKAIPTSCPSLTPNQSVPLPMNLLPLFRALQYNFLPEVTSLGKQPPVCSTITHLHALHNVPRPPFPPFPFLSCTTLHRLPFLCTFLHMVLHGPCKKYLKCLIS